MTQKLNFAVALVATSLYAAGPNSGTAPDGAVLIDQSRALAGGITADDAPGFPVTISQPGVYRLTGNLVLPSATDNGIFVAVNDVVVDLNGFTISGPNRCANFTCTVTLGGKGIYIKSLGTSNLTVRNGAIRGMGGSAIQAGIYARIENVYVENNWYGIFVGRGSIVTDCRAFHNGGSGFDADTSALFFRNVSTGNETGFRFLGTLPTGWGHNSAFDNKINQTVFTAPRTLAPNLCAGNGGTCL